ncbi:MAG TPA: hypothetical protein PKJ71_04645, partial [Bacteroidales bacterium]|nr:hypothetical protein [Bacteroidales bacterium]
EICIPQHFLLKDSPQDPQAMNMTPKDDLSQQLRNLMVKNLSQSQIREQEIQSHSQVLTT